MTAPWLISINITSNCPEAADGAAFQAHIGEVARKAWVAMEGLKPNEAVDGRLPCGCAYGTAQVSTELSKGIEREFRSVMRSRPPK